ncbi:dymeclin isoform X2 [Cylas formicarius]|uniref:dymeclin isoform X2 n=1 Tax=Cylas formicarius TaxID=197179 RepID=UPI00295875F9|nr:dymeclin isoform X2 [Cylas formicarius]
MRSKTNDDVKNCTCLILFNYLTMGVAVSRNLDLSANEYCLKFVGREPITQNDPFWNRFLSFNIFSPTSRDDQLFLEAKIEPLCQELLKNNSSSGNLGTLLQLFSDRSSELLSVDDSEPNVFNWQLYNTLFTIRCTLKFLTETVTEDELLNIIECNGNGLTLETFIGSLFGIIVDVPVQDSTFGVHLEAITCLLVLLSVQFHSGQRSDHSRIYFIVMKGRHIIHTPLFVKCLLTNFVSQLKPPAGFNGNPGHSLVLGLASELWSLLTFNRKLDNQPVSEQSEYQNCPLAVHSLLLLLVLVHNWTTLNNPYRLSLFSCVNQDNNAVLPTKEATLFKVDFNSLYLTLCKKITGDGPTLLLYLLLHRNAAFKTYLLDRLDLQELIVPILRTLYHAPNSHSHHIYMSLIILLILSEDETFNKTIHEIKLKNITWYTERSLTEISLGGLLILVIIRTIQYNMLKMRDKYLHTNCLAALANMSSQFRDLHPYVSQRFVSLFETLAKKYQKLSGRLKDNKHLNDSDTSTCVTQDENELEQDINVLEEILRMILEILNSCLSTQLVNNPNLIYNLLYNKHVFESLKDNMVFKDIIHNIAVIIRHFSELLCDKKQQNEVDAHQVLQVIRQGSKYWPKDKITKFPDLKFKYVEEDQPEEFFIPYVWELVNRLSILTWSTLSTSTVIC